MLQFRKGKRTDVCPDCGKARKYVVYDVGNPSQVICIPCLKERGNEYGLMLNKWRTDFLEKVTLIYTDIVKAYLQSGVEPPANFIDVINDLTNRSIQVNRSGKTDTITIGWKQEGDVLDIYYHGNYKDSHGFVKGSTLNVLIDYYNKQILIDKQNISKTYN